MSKPHYKSQGGGGANIQQGGANVPPRPLPPPPPLKCSPGLHATAATRLYQAGIDEQIIMETTSHKSTDALALSRCCY